METLFNFISGLSHDSVSMALNGLWLGVVLTGLALLTWRFVKTANAATGYVVWWLVLAVVIVLPFLLGSPAADWLGPRTGQPAVTSPVATRMDLPGPEFGKHIVSPPVSREPAGLLAAPVTELPALTEAGDSARVEGPAILSLILRMLPISLFTIWVLISLLLLWRLALAHRRMTVIKRQSSPFDISRFSRLNNILSGRMARRPWRVRLSSQIEYPMAAGLGRPTVLIPRRLVNQLTGSELESVILHELAHIVRWDDWSKLGQKIIEALMFFNPAVFWIGRRLDLEREIACDDRVVEQLGKPGEYARCLTRLTQLTAMPVGASLIPGVLTSRKQIFKRFDRLLSRNRSCGTKFSRIRFIGAVAAIVLTLAVAVRVAPVIAVPVEAVTFNELSGTLQSVTENVLADMLHDEPAEFAVVEAAFVGDGDDNLPQDKNQGVERDDTFDLPISDSLYVQEPKEQAWTVLESEYLVAMNDLVDEDDDTADATDQADGRVIDWNDEIFDLRISGTIHGINGEDEGIDVWTDDRMELRAAMQGRVKFSSDGRTIRSIAKGGWLAVKEQHDDVWKELDVRPTNGPLLDYAYYVDGKPAEYDENARRWLADVLPEIVPEISTMGRREFLVPPGSAALVEPLAPLEPLEPPEPRLENKGLLSATFDLAKDVFNGFGKGLMISGDDDGEREIYWSDGRKKIRVQIDGDVVLTDDDRFIKSISPGGYFAISEKRGSKRHEFDAEPGPGGELRYSYTINGKEQDLDDDAREWLAGVLLKMSREAGIDAEGRARRIYGKDGVDGVLSEISQIKSDYVKRQYFEVLLDTDGLNDDEYSLILAQIGRELESDYEKAQLLVNMADRVSENKKLIRLYVGVVQTIESDYETRRVLSAMYMGEDADDDIVLTVLEIAATMDSDYERAELLIEMAPYCRGRGELQAAYVNAIIDLGSDYETRRVLSALSLGPDTEPEIILTVLQIAGRIDSDYEKAELLIDLAPYCRSDRALQAAYVNAIVDLESDYETRRVLSALSKDGDVDPDVLVSVLEIIDNIDSDYEKAELLVEIAQQNRAYNKARQAYLSETYPADENAYQRAHTAYLTAVTGIDSDYETKRVLTELISRGELDDKLVLDILSVIAHISSDYEKSELLKLLVKHCRGNEDLEDAFMEIVDAMDSDYESNELYRLMYRKARRSSNRY